MIFLHAGSDAERDVRLVVQGDLPDTSHTTSARVFQTVWADVPQYKYDGAAGCPLQLFKSASLA